MSTETTLYRVRRTSRDMLGVKAHEWLAYSQDLRVYVWTQRIGEADSSINYDGAKHMAAKHGGKVITVRHKLIPAKPRTHDRAWALRQLAKGRRVRHTSWNSPMYLATCEERGISLCNCRSESRVVAGVALSPADGYTLWQEPAK